MKHQAAHLAVAVALGALALSACGDTGSTTATTSGPPLTVIASTTSTAPTPTTNTTATTAPMTTTTPVPTTAPTTSTTTAPTTTTTKPTTTTTRAPSTNELASGSGCTPGTDDLPDGYWFGFVDTADSAAIGFDLACWFTGEAAALAAAEDGEESPPPNDYHIRNVSGKIRTLSVAPGASVVWMSNPGDPSTAAVITYPAWLANRLARGYQPGIWVTVVNGSISSVDEQYVP